MIKDRINVNRPEQAIAEEWQLFAWQQRASGGVDLEDLVTELLTEVLRTRALLFRVRQGQKDPARHALNCGQLHNEVLTTR